MTWNLYCVFVAHRVRTCCLISSVSCWRKLIVCKNIGYLLLSSVDSKTDSMFGLSLWKTRSIYNSKPAIVGICVPAWLNEALCGKIDFELQAKIWAKVKIFHFWYIFSKSSSYQTLFQWKCERKEVLWNIFVLISP